MRYLSQIWLIAQRECKILLKNRIYGFCMLVFPLLSLLFFTSLMDEGLPEDMPVGVVDLDNTSTSRSIIRRLDGFQSSQVVARYASVAEARHAIQENEIYAFLYIPKGTTEQLLSARRPKISYYYNLASIMSGALLMKDLKTISTLGSAAVGQATMRAKGYTPEQIQTFLQPIRIDLHQIGNPWTNYNAYLTTVFVPGVMMLFMFLISAYSLGMEFFYEFYIYYVLHFPHVGGWPMILLLALLQVFGSIGFGIFAFGLMPSLRMSMSVCSLWAVLSFSLAGSAFPVMGMDTPIQALTWLFPLRHYYMLYQITVFNGYPLIDAWFHLVALVGFTLLPWFVMHKIKNALLTYVYIP